MYKQKTVAVVVPAYNEETQIAKVLNTMPELVDHIVVIDDCSPDNTSSVVKQIQSTNRRVVLLRNEQNQGVGGSIANGYKWVRDHKLDVAVVMAGDGQMDPADLPNLLDPVVAGEVDYAKGNRLFTDEAFKKIPRTRFFGNSILSFLTKVASGYWHVFDSQTGYTAINLRALEVIDWDKMYKRYGQPNDLLVRLNVYSFRVRDVPIKPVYNVGEKSKLKVSRAIFTISQLLVRLFLWRLREKYIIRDFHPLVLFYLLGFLFFLLGSAFTVRLFWLWSKMGNVPELTFITVLFCLGFSFQATFFAMWFDMEYNKHLR